jgi:hypothetical protein
VDLVSWMCCVCGCYVGRAKDCEEGVWIAKTRSHYDYTKLMSFVTYVATTFRIENERLSICFSLSGAVEMQ